MVQNFFDKNRHRRTISLHAQYIVLFKNPRDSIEFLHQGKQLYPHNSRIAHEAYIDATKCLCKYLLLDLRSEQDDDLHLRTNIFPGEWQIVHVRKWGRGKTYYKSLQSLRCIRISRNCRKHELSPAAIHSDTKKDCAHERGEITHLPERLRPWHNRLLQCVCQNVLNNNVPLKKGQFNWLKKKKDVQKLAELRTLLKQKHSILHQEGGLVTSFLVPAITALVWVLAGQLFLQL